MQSLRSAFDHIRETYTPISKTSTFRETGQITPEEFIQAGDFLVYKFPSWSWADASTPKQRVSYLPAGKQYLVTRGVPCRRRLDENFAGGAGLDADLLVGDGDGFKSATSDGADDGWLRTGGEGEQRSSARGAAAGVDVRTVTDAGEMGERATDEDDIPDMEDEDDDDEAIIRDPKSESATPLRTYTLYITYSPYYRTPRLYLSGYQAQPGGPSTPLPPTAMMEDIVADYKDKTVTLEDFALITPTIKTASVHPCRHASVMKVLLDRADAALKLRMEKMKTTRSGSASTPSHVVKGMEGLVDQTRELDISSRHDTADVNQRQSQSQVQDAEWEDLNDEDRAPGHGDDAKTTTTTANAIRSSEGDTKNAIRVDQYLVVFLKFMASVTPGIEHDYTMGV